MSPCLTGDHNRSCRQQDSRWSYLVCASATFCYAVIMGIVLSFGVLFPAIIKRFDSSRQKAGNILFVTLKFPKLFALGVEGGSGVGGEGGSVRGVLTFLVKSMPQYLNLFLK